MSTSEPENSNDETIEIPAVTDGTSDRTPHRTAVAREAMADSPSGGRGASQGRVLAFIGAFIAILVLSATYLQSHRDTTGDTSSTDAVPTGVTQKFGILHGEADAPVKVVVYEDFMCPACAQFEDLHAANTALLVEKGVISMEYRMLSFLDRASTTDYSTRAMNAYITVMGKDSGNDVAEQFRQTLFLNQPAEGGPGLSDEDLVAIAERLGAPSDAVERSQDGLLYEAYILNANDAASKDGVNQTPTVLVDGQALKNPFADFIPAVLEAAEAAGVDVDALTGEGQNAPEKGSK